MKNRQEQQPPASLWNQAVNVLYRTRQGLRRGKAPRRQYPPNTNKYKGGTLESPSRVRAGTAKGRSPQQTCVGWNRRRVEALGNAPPLRPCETPELMKRKQAAYRRSQHGALRSRSPPTIRLTLLPMPVSFFWRLAPLFTLLLQIGPRLTVYA